MKILNTLITITGLLLLAACGKSASSNNPGAIATNAASTVSAQEKYNSLNVQELPVVQNGIVGGFVFQRKAGNIICRKSGAVVPNPVYEYKCWQQVSSDSQAYQTFNSFPFQNQHDVNIGNATTSREVFSADKSTLCQKTIVNLQNMASTYACFNRI